MPANDLSAYSDEELERIASGSSAPDLSALSDEELEKIAGGDVSLAESGYRGAVQGASLGFGDEVSAGIGAGLYGVAKGVRSLLPGGVPEGAPSVGEVYTQIRDQLRAENAAAEEANPGTYFAGEVGGVVASSGVNPVSVVRAGGRSLLALGTREAYTAAAGRALLTQGVKGAAVGGGLGAVNAAGASEASVGSEEFFTDVLGGAESGAKAGAVLGGLLGVGSRATGLRSERLAADAATAEKVVAFDDELASLPERTAAVKAGNAAEREAAATANATARETADAQNLAARERFKADTAAAKAEAKAATKANQEAAQQSTREQTLANPLVRTGLEGKQSTLRGPKRARARAQALVDEPLPGDPSKKLVDEAEKLDPATRLDLANRLRSEQGAILGAVRKELEKTNATFPAEAIKAELRGAFGELPTEVQGRALEQLDAQIGALAKDGALSPAALRKLINDAEAYTKYSTPSLEAALGNTRGRVFQTARAVLVSNEQAAVAAKLPGPRVEAYEEALRKYGVYSDFELGSDVIFRRTNKGQPAVKIPKAAKVEAVAPREVPKPSKVEPTLREPLLQPEPQAPQFPGGEEALAAGRKLLQPSATVQAVAEGINSGLPALAGAAGYAAGGYLAGAVATFAGAKLSKPASNLWLRVMTPTAGSLSKEAAKLERLKPMMEEALQKGPAEVARVHALFMQRSPDYRKAVESEE